MPPAVTRRYRPGMFRRAEPRDADVPAPHPLGAKGRMAALTGGFAAGGGAAESRIEGDAATRADTGDADGAAAGGAVGPDTGGAAAGWVPDRRAPGAGRGRALAARLTTAGPWGELAERWVPESLRGARIDPKRRGALLVSAVAAIAAVTAAIGVWWSRPQPTPVVPAVSAASEAVGLLGAAGVAGDVPVEEAIIDGTGSTTGEAVGATTQPGRAETPAASATVGSSGTIVVSVTGQVRHPGVVTVPADARVADAIAAAGGALDESDLTGLNLAAHLTDGSSVVVAASGGGVVTPEPAGADAGGEPAGGTGAKVSLNAADAAALQTLPGIGPVTAAAIIAYRAEHGPFTDLAQLQDVSGIGPATFARLEPNVTL